MASGHPSIVLVEGEAGIGETRLLADALGDARSRGLQAVTGQTQELERARPFRVLADAFGWAASSADPRRRAIAALLATSAGDRGPVTVTSDPGLQFQAVDAFVDLAESLALDRPLVVGVDDLQWADPSSLLTLVALGGRLAGMPVALLACPRPSPHAAELERALQALDAAAGARRLVLGARIGLCLTKAGTLSTVHEIPDISLIWRLVASYGGKEVYRETLARTALSAHDWTFTIPADATAPAGGFL